jgi:hypothetical protein
MEKSEKEPAVCFDDVPQDPPPAYEDVFETPQGSHLPRVIQALTHPWSSHSRKIEAWRPQNQIQFLLPDPRHIQCRCGRHVDTTIGDWLLPAGKVSCSCGYIVSSDGYASFPHKSGETSPIIKCSCGTPLPLRKPALETFSCECGAMFLSNGDARRLCPQHEVRSLDACNVRCKCGNYVDTTGEWTIRHNGRKVEDGSSRSYSMYDYVLSAGCGRCVCGLTARRIGSCITGHPTSCCSVLRVSKTARGGFGCTCAWP